MNTIQIDEDAVRAELKEIQGEYLPGGESASEPPEDEGETGEQSPENPPMDWSIPAGLIVMILDRIVAPNWQLEDGEKELLQAQFVGTLQVFFPTLNVDPRIVALCSLGGALAAIAARRVGPDGRLKPLHAEKPQENESQHGPSGEPAGR